MDVAHKPTPNPAEHGSSAGSEPRDYCVYLLYCADTTYYCGVTNNLEARVKRHNAGRGSKYVRSRLPCVVLGFSRPLTKREALRHERAIKALPRREKLTAVLGI